MKNQFSLLLVLVYPPSFFLSVTKSPIGFRFILFILLPLLFLLLAAQTTFFGFVWSWYAGLVSMRKHDFFLLQSDYKGKDLPLSGIIPSVCTVLLPFACAATVLFPANAIFLSDKILPSFSFLPMLFSMPVRFACFAYPFYTTVWTKRAESPPSLQELPLSSFCAHLFPICNASVYPNARIFFRISFSAIVLSIYGNSAGFPQVFAS